VKPSSRLCNQRFYILTQLNLTENKQLSHKKNLLNSTDTICIGVQKNREPASLFDALCIIRDIRKPTVEHVDKDILQSPCASDQQQIQIF